MGGKKKYINIFGSFTEPFKYLCGTVLTLQHNCCAGLLTQSVEL